MRMPRFCSSASFTASSIEIRRTTSPPGCAAACAAAASRLLARRNCSLCAKTDDGRRTIDAAITATEVRRMVWNRRISDAPSGRRKSRIGLICRRPAGKYGSGNCILRPRFFEDPMHISASRLTCGLAALVLAATSAHLAGTSPAIGAGAPQSAKPAAFDLTVDSVMRGPKLVGYPPTGLRWSGDSARLYFEWRRPQDDEASTWVVSRDGSDLRKLSEEERRSAPPVIGAWDAAHRRVLFVDRGDIVLLDSVSGAAARSRARWATNRTRAGRAMKRRSRSRARTTCFWYRSTAPRRAE